MVLDEDLAQVRLVEWDQVIRALAPDAADAALGVPIGISDIVRRLNDKAEEATPPTRRATC